MGEGEQRSERREAKRISSDINAKLPSNVKLIVEGSGANTKYYAQLGADTASKKPLGNPSVSCKRVSWSGRASLTQNIDIGKNLELYKSIFPVLREGGHVQDGTIDGQFSVAYTYNAGTGILTITLAPDKYICGGTHTFDIYTLG